MSNEVPYYFLTLPIVETIDPIGSLQDMPSYAVMLWCHRRRFTGRLVLERDKRVKHIFFSAGDLVAIRSNLIMEGIDMVLKKGFLDPQYVVQIQQEVVAGTLDEDWEDRMVYHLLAKERLPVDRLRDALDIQMYEQVLNALGWMDGKYFLKEMEAAPPRYEFHQTKIALGPFFRDLDRFLKSGTPGFVPAKIADAVAEPAGELGISGGATVVCHIAQRRGNGKLVFRRGRKRKDFLFRDGKIFSVSTSDAKETLEWVLERWRYLPRDIIQSVAGQARISGSKLRQSLLTQKLIRESELAESLRILHLERVLETFAWRSGHYEWFAFDAPEDGAEEKEERTNAESSRNIRTYSDVMQEIARYTHRKHLFLAEATPLRAVQRNQILEDFLGAVPRTIALTLADHADALRVSERRADWDAWLAEKHLEIHAGDYAALSAEARAEWTSLLAGRFDAVLWFCAVDSLALPERDACAFLLLPPELIPPEALRARLDLARLPKLDGYFTIIRG